MCVVSFRELSFVFLFELETNERFSPLSLLTFSIYFLVLFLFYWSSLHVDSRSKIALEKNSLFHDDLSKHIHIRFHFIIKDCISRKRVEVEYKKTEKK